MVSTSSPGRFFPPPSKFTHIEGVRGVIILDKAGHPLQSDFDVETTENVATQVLPLLKLVQAVVDTLQEGGFKYLRLETNKGEVLVAPDDAGLILIVVKSPDFPIGSKRIVMTSNPVRFFPSPLKFTRYEGVRGVIVLDNGGHPIQSDFDPVTTEGVAGQILPLITKARGVISSLHEGNLQILRLRTNKEEVMLFRDDPGLIYIIQKTSESPTF